ncbi:MAG: hypothetical protein ABI700_14045 [Chloroflexota bacterium]
MIRSGRRPFVIVVIVVLICMILTTSALVVGQGMPNSVLAYTQSLPKGNTDLYLLDLPTRVIVNLLRTPREYEAEAVWSADGQRFAYQRKVGDDLSQICIFEYAIHCYPAAGTFDTQPSLSSDGHSLAFLSAGSQLFVRDLRDNSLARLGLPYQRFFNPAWSPDGSQLAFVEVAEAVYNRQLYISNPDLTHARRITTPKLQVLSPAWSPDGKQIVFVGTDDRGDNIYILDLDSGATRQISSGDFDATPLWSPDGSKILFTSVRTDFVDLYLVNADGTDEHAITTDDEDNFAPIWSADGRQIIFVRTMDSGDHLTSLDLATGAIQPLTAGEGDQVDPALRP